MKPTHEEFQFICTGCGCLTMHFVDDPKESVHKPIACKKCGNMARIFTLTGMWPIIREIILENVKIRHKIFDLECSIEQLADPHLSPE